MSSRQVSKIDAVALFFGVEDFMPKPFWLKLGRLSALAIFFIACSSTPTPPADTGVAGQILIGPRCPVVQEDTPCPDQPYQATLTVLDQSGQPVAQFKSDAQGKFRVSLSPGVYTLRPESSDNFTRAAEQSVVVTSGQYTLVTITYDSGIR